MSLVDAFLLDPAPFHVWLSTRNDSNGSGKVTDPYRADTAAKFDEVMRNLPANTNIVVHLSPGTFETQGYYDGAANDYGWQIRPRMRIVGSGMDITTLKIVAPATPAGSSHVFAIGHSMETGNPAMPNLVDYAEVCDLTINPNIAQTGLTSARRGAVRLMGNHVRVRRVRVVGWGTMVATSSGIGIALISANPSIGVNSLMDLAVEDCLLVDPVLTGGPVLGVYAGPKQLEGSETLPFMEGNVEGATIRNCYLDYSTAAGSLNSTYEHAGLTMAWCTMGVVEGNQVYNVKNGAMFLQHGGLRDIVVRNNYFKNVVKGIHWNPGFSPVAGSPQASVSGGTATIILNGQPFSVDDLVRVVGSGGFTQLDGIHRVASVGTDLFRFSTSTSNTTQQYPVTVSKVYRDFKPVVESNVVEISTSAGVSGIHFDDGALVQDSGFPAYVHQDVLLRNNKLRYVDGVINGSYTGIAAKVFGAKTLTVQNQVVESDPANPLRNSRCGAVTYFNNKTPAGVLKRGYNEATSLVYYELEDEAEEAFMLSTIRRK